MPADLNNDGEVDSFDLSTLLSNWGTADINSDLNSDGTVDSFDLSTLLSEWGPVAAANYALQYSLNGRGIEPLQSLNGASIENPFWVRLDYSNVDVANIDTIEWHIDGVLYRDNDADEPFDIRYTAACPINTDFSSDQGLPGTFHFATGNSYTIMARVVYTDTTTEDVSANFTIQAAPVFTPSIIAGPAVNINGTNAIISWSTDEPSDSLVEYDTNSGTPYSSQQSSASDVLSHSISLVGLQENTQYYYRVTSTNSAGSDTSSEATFTTGEASAIAHGYDLNETNTGIAAAGLTTGDLTPSGSVTTTSDGQVIENLHITGSVNVRHNNVTVRNCIIDGNLSTSYCINFHTSTPVTGTMIEYCDLTQATSSGIVHFSPYTMRWCKSYNHPADGAKIGRDSTIEYCWIYGLYKEGSSHNDCIQMRNGANTVIRYNRLECIWQSQTGALLAQAADGDITNLYLEKNFFSGGSYSLYLTEPNNQMSGTTVIDNLWAENSASAGPLSMHGGVGLSAWSGNEIAPVTTGGSSVHPVLVNRAAATPFNI